MNEGTQQTVTPREFQEDVLSPKAVQTIEGRYLKMVDALDKANQRIAELETSLIKALNQVEALERTITKK